MKTKNIGEPGAPPVQQWADVAKAIATDYAPGKELSEGPPSYTTWLTTINPDGTPHVTPVGALFFADTFWFQTGDQTQKAKNLARDARCSVSISLQGLDLVFDGSAAKTTDQDAIARCVADWNKGGWPVEVDASGVGLTAPFNAPGIGPAPWFVYRVAPRAATSVLTTMDVGGSTRWFF
jgi:hypothetical protein